MIDILAIMILALTDLQVDRMFDGVSSAGRAFSEAIKTLWIAFGPIAISYILWRVSKLQKNSEDNTTKILGAGAEREARLSAQVTENTELTHAVKAVAVESVKKADKAYNEANNVNLKLASMGIQTKPELGATAENPVHTISP